MKGWTDEGAGADGRRMPTAVQMAAVRRGAWAVFAEVEVQAAGRDQEA